MDGKLAGSAGTSQISICLCPGRLYRSRFFLPNNTLPALSTAPNQTASMCVKAEPQMHTFLHCNSFLSIIKYQYLRIFLLIAAHAGLLFFWLFQALKEIKKNHAITSLTLQAKKSCLLPF